MQIAKKSLAVLHDMHLTLRIFQNSQAYLVVLGLTALLDSTSVYVVSWRERERNNSQPHLLSKVGLYQISRTHRH